MKSIFIILPLLFFFSCHEQEATSAIKSTEDSPLKSFEEIRNTLHGAEFSIGYEKIRLLNFSDSIQQDTFKIRVGSGLLGKSKSVLQIIKVGGGVIYTDTFASNYFIWDLFSVLVPNSVKADSVEQYELEQWNAITKAQYEEEAKKNIDHLFDNIEVDSTSWEEAQEIGDIIDKESFIEAGKFPLISFPCFTCDEGTKYIGYSKNKNKAILILETD
ncbi:MAG: hypothetical protein NT150_01440 [Bacteroidetes bacterium]|nr:hypothetical protein [Bacteroidota bacterium]